MAATTDSDKTLISTLLTLVGDDRCLVIHKALIEFTGSLETAAVLERILYWAPRSQQTDGSFYKSDADWCEETLLSRYAVMEARKRLVDMGFLTTETRQARGKPTTFYLLNWQALALEWAKWIGDGQPRRKAKGNGWESGKRTQAPATPQEHCLDSDNEPFHCLDSDRPLSESRQSITIEIHNRDKEQVTGPTPGTSPDAHLPCKARQFSVAEVYLPITHLAAADALEKAREALRPAEGAAPAPGKPKRTRKPAPDRSALQAAHFDLSVAIADVCGMDLDKNKGRIMAAAKKLRQGANPATPDEVRLRYGRGGYWYKHDWRGKKRQLPKPEAIVETWGEWEHLPQEAATLGQGGQQDGRDGITSRTPTDEDRAAYREARLRAVSWA